MARPVVEKKQNPEGREDAELGFYLSFSGRNLMPENQVWKWNKYQDNKTFAYMARTDLPPVQGVQMEDWINFFNSLQSKSQITGGVEVNHIGEENGCGTFQASCRSKQLHVLEPVFKPLDPLQLTNTCIPA